MVGASRESVNKHLRAWTEAGILTTTRGKITVLDRDGLTALARDVPTE